MQESIHEAATLYSLGLLEAGEAAIFEDRLGADPKLAAFLQELTELNGSILTAEARIAARPAPGYLKGRILERIATAVQHRFPFKVISALQEAAHPQPRIASVVAFADREGILDWVSPAFEEMCGYRLEEMRGLKAGTRLRGELSQAEAKQRLTNAVAQRIPVVQRIVNYRKNGVPYLVEIDLRPVSTGFVAVERSLGLAA